MCVDGTANMCCTICKQFPYCTPRTKICWFFARTQRELGALGIPCSPKVHRKFIHHAPSPNCSQTIWFVCGLHVCTSFNTVQHCCNLCLKGCSILIQGDVPFHFALVSADFCPSPLLITSSICKPNMSFSQLFGPTFLPLLPSSYHCLILAKCAPWGYVVFYYTELIVHFICFCQDPIMPYF